VKVSSKLKRFCSALLIAGATFVIVFVVAELPFVRSWATSHNLEKQLESVKLQLNGLFAAAIGTLVIVSRVGSLRINFLHHL
jgi:hypothetical protein